MNKTFHFVVVVVHDMFYRGVGEERIHVGCLVSALALGGLIAFSLSLERERERERRELAWHRGVAP